jgi:cytochrome b subunit of formate dehydrogenase
VPIGRTRVGDARMNLELWSTRLSRVRITTSSSPLTKLVTIAAAVHVVDHRYRARVNGATRHALRGMLTGEADRQWAREHHPPWEP